MSSTRSQGSLNFWGWSGASSRQQRSELVDYYSFVARRLIVKRGASCNCYRPRTRSKWTRFLSCHLSACGAAPAGGEGTRRRRERETGRGRYWRRSRGSSGARRHRRRGQELSSQANRWPPLPCAGKPSSLVPCAQLPPAPDAVLQPLALPSFPLTLSLPLSLIDRDWVRRMESRSDAMAKARLTDGTRHLPFHIMATNGTRARH